jgi:ABC-2 type transport system permease protein
MMAGFWRYSKLLWLLIKIGFMRQMAYRSHFVMMVAGKVIRMGLLFIFFQAIFFRVHRIGLWTYDHVLLLFATFHIVDYLISITFQRNLAFQLPRRIQTGDLDSRIILPVNLLFIVSLEEVDLMDFFSFIPCLGFLGWALYRLEFDFSWIQFLVYILLVLNALVFLFSAVLSIATLSFWSTRSDGLARIFDNLLKVGRYPLDIFEGFWRSLFIYVLPLVLIAQLPTQAILKTLSPEMLLFAFGISGLFLLLSLTFWKLGIKNYLSVGT